MAGSCLNDYTVVSSVSRLRQHSSGWPTGGSAVVPPIYAVDGVVDIAVVDSTDAGAGPGSTVRTAGSRRSAVNVDSSSIAQSRAWRWRSLFFTSLYRT